MRAGGCRGSSAGIPICGSSGSRRACTSSPRRSGGWIRATVGSGPPAGQSSRRNRPPHYFRHNVSLTYISDPSASTTSRFTGADRLMWSGDYPHGASTWPRSRDVVERRARRPCARRTSELTSANCAALYGIDLAEVVEPARSSAPGPLRRCRRAVSSSSRIGISSAAVTRCRLGSIGHVWRPDAGRTRMRPAGHVQVAVRLPKSAWTAAGRPLKHWHCGQPADASVQVPFFPA